LKEEAQPTIQCLELLCFHERILRSKKANVNIYLT